ncbi:MAG: DUF1631 domain-containing protein [bacterium]
MHNKDAENITQLTDFRHAPETNGQKRPPALVKQLRNASRHILEAGLREMFDNVDDTLFDLAEKADSNQIQTLYFDGMREVRKSRTRFEQVFSKTLEKYFEAYSTGKELPFMQQETSIQKDGLKLVDEIELEESLAINNMVAKAENRLTQLLFALNERLAVVAGGAEIDNASNPIAPKAICESLREASVELELEVSVKLIIFKLFEKLVLTTLPNLYGRLNQTLKESGVLPELKPRLRRQGPPQGAYHPPGSPVAQAGLDETATEFAENAPETYSQQPQPGGYTQIQDGYDPAYQAISNLLANRRGPAQGNPSFDSNGQPHPAYGDAQAGQFYPAIDHQSLLNAIALLQQSSTNNGSEAFSALDAEDLKQSLMGEIEKLTSDETPHNLAHADEDTIDLVGMLFQFVVDDGNLPAEIKAILSRLQIPYLKAALLNKELFQSRRNPARHLLDTLASAGMGWTKESDPKGQLIGQIEHTVGRLLDDFHDNLSLFDELQDELDEWLKKYNRRANAAEKRTTEATRGKETLSQARTRVTEEIQQIIEFHNEPLPKAILEALTRPWANVLSITYLRSGPDSKPWKHALRFARDLAWAGLPKQPEDQEKLEQMAPVLDKALRRGLSLIGYHQQDADRICGNVQEVLNAHFETDKEEPEKLSLTEFALKQQTDEKPSSAMLEQHFVEKIIVSSDSIETNIVEESTLIDETIMEQVRNLTPGQWVSFNDDEGKSSRSKLSWKSPISGRYLFVNQKGLKVADKSAEELAQAIQSEQAFILSDEPLMDRALHAIATQLEDKDESKEPETDETQEE